MSFQVLSVTQSDVVLKGQFRPFGVSIGMYERILSQASLSDAQKGPVEASLPLTLSEEPEPLFHNPLKGI